MLPLKTNNDVVFDPHNPEHRKAYFILRFHHRQTPGLRFKLLPGYYTIPAMCEDRLKYAVFDHQEIDDVLAMRFPRPELTVS